MNFTDEDELNTEETLKSVNSTNATGECSQPQDVLSDEDHETE